jgi:ATP-dependent Lhr-like helicase
MGTIVSNPAMHVKFLGGGRLGTIEEGFISRLKPGDVFWFAGKVLELIHVRDLQAVVKKSTKNQGLVPSWDGGRMPLSSELTAMLRRKLAAAQRSEIPLDAELTLLKPLFDLQVQRSAIPDENQFLIESFASADGYHAFFYPFDGRSVHEGLSSLIAYRISLIAPITFSIAMNDYGFELLSDQPIPLTEALEEDLFRMEGLQEDILASINSTEMARRKFRDIAGIAGLVFQGFPGKLIGSKHLQSSARLIFDVLQQYDPGNLLLKQAYQEVFDNQLEEKRMRNALERINTQEILLKFPEKYTPFSFPIMVDRLREKLTSESLEDRVKKMKISLEK